MCPAEVERYRGAAGADHMHMCICAGSCTGRYACICSAGRYADVQVVDVQTDMRADMQADFIMQADMQHVHVQAGENVKICKICKMCKRCKRCKKCRGAVEQRYRSREMQKLCRLLQVADPQV